MTNPGAQPLIPLSDETALHAPEQQYRAGAYALLGALLRDVPSADTLVVEG